MKGMRKDNQEGMRRKIGRMRRRRRKIGRKGGRTSRSA